MINYALIAKALEIKGDSQESIKSTMTELAQHVKDKFVTDFVVFLDERLEDDTRLKEYKDFVESIDNIDEAGIEAHRKWLDDNVALDMDDFWDQFENDLKDLEIEIIENIQAKLSGEQKDELLAFLDDQNDYLKQAHEEIEEAFGN